MPVIDKPLDELRKYKGMNPKLPDFDAYWEVALREMRAVDPQVRLEKAEYQLPGVECYHLYFTGVKGARIHAQYVRPAKSDGPAPAVILFHGYSGNAGDWTEKLGYASLGFHVFAMDCRGQGGKSEDVGGTIGNTLQGHIIRGVDGDPQNMLFRHIFLDAVQLTGIAMDMPEIDENRVGVTGWSQGGGITLACAALEPRVRRAAPVYPFLSDYRRVWEMDLAKNAYEELRLYFRRFDPQHEREEELFAKLGYIDVHHLASRIQAEVLMGVGLMDEICPPSTQFAAYNAITSPKKLEIYPDFGHEGLPGMHDKIVQFMLGM
ncbi:alpha/beta fold hydrolase [Paenibacillus phoenicis]|uniref:Alpha/beta fold hydrolase n=1 Tax=Paenibacillus phoenicis TaxID=554117 RepID=A0ABU5PF15_9BACL|nr:MULTISPECIES: alpha/beta fold hydrolase [Paenibacillus]EES73614.1 putative cephalosporin C deacetylase [Paenibacillus sp. oral taxon 786 str. D14]MCT2193627.1 acetylxylan esterase [Paenibacillus sp. p3-SID1389]MEA3568435.1 alpha/beta fold hydrolase [Paenibacillus phoenicis]